MAMSVTNNSFKNGNIVPLKYTCKGVNVSPEITWGKLPEGTESVAIICDDPDSYGGDWVHWVIYDIPGTATGIAESVSKTDKLPTGSQEGINDYKKIGYDGPCPPPGKPHRYAYKVYALDTVLKAGPGLTKRDLLKLMEGHVLDSGELMGVFSR